MSRFSGKQFRGAARVLKETRRKEAEARQKKSNERHQALLEEIASVLVEIYSPEELAEKLDTKNDNPGPALPGLAKRARKVTRK